MLGAQTVYRYTTDTYGSVYMLDSVSEPLGGSKKRHTRFIRNDKGTITRVDVTQGDANGNLLGRTLFEGIDAHGNVTKIRTVNGLTESVVTLEYGAAHNGAFPTRRSAVVKDAAGQSATVSQSASYDKVSGRMLSFTDGRGNATTYTYDELGRLLQAVQPDDSRITIVYDDVRNEVHTIDESGATVVQRWNPLGLPLQTGILRGDEFEAKATYSYDSRGLLIGTTDAKGNVAAQTNDEWGRILSVTAPDGSKTVYQYDDMNRKMTATDPEKVQSIETYDIAGRMTREDTVRLSGTSTVSYTYDLQGNVLTAVDPNQNSTVYTYSDMDELLTVKNALQETTAYEYNMLGQLRYTIFPDGARKEKQYDELGRVIKEIDEKGKASTYTYDANGNLIKVVDKSGAITSYTYDNRDRLTKRVSPDETVTFSYDAAGRRTAMTDKTGSWSYRYDADTGELLETTYPDGRTIAYEYDAAGMRTRMTDPFGGIVSYRYDGQNRLSSVGTPENEQEAAYTYYKNGLLKRAVLGNGMSADYQYDGYALSGLQYRSGAQTPLQSYGYTHDKNGNIIGRSAGGASDTFGYDKLNRITASTQLAESYAYDNRGNLKSVKRNKKIENDNKTLGYDKQNRLTQVVKTDGTTVNYAYNGDGQLYERTENGGVTRYYYDGDQLIAEATVEGGAATLKARYIRGAGLIAQQNDLGDKYYYTRNGHGDVTGLWDEWGTQVNQYAYDIWGNVLSEREAVDNPFKYSSEYWDDTTSLQYLRARWYDPADGRFISKDMYEGQLDNPLSQNLYTYVHNNPLRYIDPTGHACQSANGKYTHSGDCSSDSSIWIPDELYNASRDKSSGLYGTSFKELHQLYGEYKAISGLMSSVNQYYIDRQRQIVSFMDDITGVTDMRTLVSPNATPLEVWVAVASLVPVPGPDGIDTKHLGKKFGKMGTVVSKPEGLKITGYSNHVLKRFEERSLTKKTAKSIVSKPMFVLEQRNGGAYAFVSGKGVVVLDKNGHAITAWSANDFDSNMIAMIEELSK